MRDTVQTDDIIEVHPGEAWSIGRLEAGDEVRHLRKSVDEDEN